jgi:glycine/D-amino acid oxidase-like deaminating enzyme/nitrite reductase/ring-hydroxylating ferredoxin subunit
MINRDSYTTSLWQDHVNPYQAMNRAGNEQVYDVIIIGGGITGVSTALLLQEEGKKCLLVEAHNIGYGTSGGTTAHLNTLLDIPYYTMQKNFGKEKASQVYTSVEEAINLIKYNIDRFNINCGFEFANAYLFAQDEDQQKELDEIIETSRECGLKIEETSEIPVPISFVKAAKAAMQAKFNPLQYIHGLAKAYEELGGIIIEDCRVTEIDNAEHVTVHTTCGSFSATDVVYATHIPPGINLLHLRCVPYRTYAMAVTLPEDAYPEGLIYDMYDPYHYYRTQEVNGKKYFIAGGEDHQTGHLENTNQCFLKLESHLRQHFDVQSVDYSWSSQYYESADGLPYIGNLPGQSSHVYVASGFGGNGMTYSSVAALLLKRIILEKQPFNESLFDPNRIKPVAGFSTFIGHNADVVKLFLEKLLPSDKLAELAGIAPGEGKIVKYEGHTVALFKGDDGDIHAINPTCTHMSCSVAWNNAERSWDCPCHGARYDVDGVVLNTPADKDLQQVPLTKEELSQSHTSL